MNIFKLTPRPSSTHQEAINNMVMNASLHHLSRFCSTLAKWSSNTDPFPVRSRERLRRAPREVLLPAGRGLGMLPLLVCTGLSTTCSALGSPSASFVDETRAYFPRPAPSCGVEPTPLIALRAMSSVVNECEWSECTEVVGAPLEGEDR